MLQLRRNRFCGTGVRAVRSACGLALALTLGACATEPAYRQQVAGPAHQIARAPAVEVEDDGLPAQTPPPPRNAREADDPSEPFSPNYGSPNYGSPNNRGSTVAAPPRVVSSLTTTTAAGRFIASAQN